jgi:uncharacterized protein (TIGR03086 family)
MASLLEQSAGYAMGAVGRVAPEFLSRPTPCAGWDLRMLLDHASESLAAVHEGLTEGQVALIADGDIRPADPVRVFRDRVCLVLRASAATGCADTACADGGCAGEGCAGGNERAPIAIADRSVPASVVIAMAAIEIAVHGWDVSQACGQCLPIPHALAADLLELSVLLVPRAGRYPLFGPPVPVPRTASPSDRLAAFLGRTASSPPTCC